MSNKTVKVLGLDPGKVNFAASLVEISLYRTLRVNVLRNGLLTNTVSDINFGVRGRLRNYIQEISSMIEQDVELIICERFQSRGLRGNTVESINMMLGALLVNIYAHHPKIRVKLITASTWKNHANKVLDLDQLYKYSKSTPHQVDATLMAIFAAYKRFEPHRIFHHLQSVNKIHQVVQSIEDSSWEKLHDRKSRK